MRLKVAALMVVGTLTGCVAPVATPTVKSQSERPAPKPSAAPIDLNPTASGGNVISTGGGNLIGQAGGNVIATGGGNTLSPVANSPLNPEPVMENQPESPDDQATRSASPS